MHLKLEQWKLSSLTTEGIKIGKKKKSKQSLRDLWDNNNSNKNLCLLSLESKERSLSKSEGLKK